MVDEIKKQTVDTSAIQYKKVIQNSNNAIKPNVELQKFAAQTLAGLYDNCANILEEYNKNRGIADVGTYLEGARKVIDWASFGNIKSTSHIKDNLREKANELKNIDTTDSEAFKKRFQELSGVEYNEENIQKFMALVNQEGVDTQSDEFKEACYKAFGLKGTEKQEKYVKRSSFVDGIGDIVLMLVTMGAVSKTKMMGKLTTKLYKTLEQGTAKFLHGDKTQKAAKLGTSMVMGGATLGGYTLTKETLDNLSNPVRDAKSFSTWKQTGIASLESFGFGAFGGLLNETVVAPLVKYLGKPGKQVSQAVGKALSNNAELSGKDIMQTAINAQNLNLSGLFRMNAVELKNYAQILGAHAAGFGVEVVGFAGYEAGLDAIKDICDPQTGRLPENMTLANLTKYLADKIGEQFSNLGTIKGISQLLMMSKGGKAAQSAMMNKMIADSQKLNDVKFKKVNQNGNEVIEMTLPDGGKKLVSSTDQVVQTCQTLMQMEFVVNNLRPEEKVDPQTEEKSDLQPEGKPNPQTEEIKVEPEKVEKSGNADKSEATEQTEKAEEKVEVTAPINQKLSVSVATNADLRAIQKIDMEAFEGRYVIDSDFEAYKADLLEQEIKTYAIKSESGDVVGYYQLEPVENGELYIHSIGVKKELRNSRTSYNALKQIQNAITEIAKDQNLDKVVLDVDAGKPELVKLYKKFGFEITGESRGTEYGQRYHDYRMEADVKKIFAKDTANIEGVNNEVKGAQESVKEAQPAQQIKTETVKEEAPVQETIEETKPAQEVENTGETTAATNEAVVKVEYKPFFEPRRLPQEGLRDISIDRTDNKYAVKIYERDGKEFFKIEDTEFEITLSNDTKEIAKQLWANMLYIKAGFSVDEMFKYSEGEKSGYITRHTTKPFYAIEKLQKDYGINIFIDEMQIEQDTVTFHKGGKTVELKIVEDGDARLADTAAKNNTVYITESELLFTLEKFSNLERYTVDKGDAIGYKYDGYKIPFADELAPYFSSAYNEIKEQYNTLKLMKLREGTNSFNYKSLEDRISQEMQNVEIDEGRQRRFDSLLNENVEERYKDYQTLKKEHKDLQNFFRSKLEECPELKPFIAEMYDLLVVNSGNKGDIFNYIKDHYYVHIEPERAVALLKILNNKEVFQGAHALTEDITKTQNIPTKILCRLVFEENIKSFNQLKEAYDNFCKAKKDELRLSEYSELSEFVENDLVKNCLDEYGEIDNNKVTLVKILLQKSPEFGEKYTSYNSSGPYSLASEIALAIKNEYQCADVLENILPMLEQNGIEYKSKYTPKDIKTLLSCNPHNRATVIEQIKNLREIVSFGYNYNIDPKETATARTKLYNEMQKEGYKSYIIDKILDKSKMYPLDIVNLETVEFLKALEQFEAKEVDSGGLRDMYARDYLECCETNDYEGKKEIIRRIHQIGKLINDPLRETGRLSVENAARLVDLPADKYQQVYDAIFIKDADGFMIPFNDNRDDFQKIVDLMSDDTNAKHFFEDYLPLAKQHKGRGLNYAYIIETVLKAERRDYDNNVESKTEYPLAIAQLKYLLENSNFEDRSLRDAVTFNPKQFNRLKQDLLNIEVLGENQPYDFAKNEIAQLPDNEYMIFKNILLPRLPGLFKDQSIKEHYAKLYKDYLKLTPAQLDKLADTIEFFTANAGKIEMKGNKKAESKDISNLIHGNYESVLNIIETTGQEGMNCAIKYNYEELKQLLENTDSIKQLDHFAKSVIRENLNTLDTPDQKLETLSVISGITKKLSQSELVDIITSGKLDTITTSLDYFLENIQKLEHADIDVTADMVRQIIYDNPKSVLNIVDITSETELRHAIGTRYKGLKALLENTAPLSNLTPEARTLLKDKLAQLPHPEQKLAKLPVIASLTGKVDNSTLINIINSIKSPEMTVRQEELADKIFENPNEPYKEQIERFIKEFDVPESKQELIRKFLLKQNLQSKFVTPPPFEKQLAILDKKIKTVEENDKIPQAKKDAYLEILRKQKAALIANPEKYTARRLNEAVMKNLAKQVEAHINLPNNNRAFNKLINKELYKIFGIELTEDLLNANIEYEPKYFAEFFKNTSSNFKSQFQKLMKLIEANPNKKLSEILDTIPTNMKTRRLFEQNGLNYDRWIKYDENFNHKFEFVIDVAKSLQAAKDNLMLEFNSELAQKLDPAQIAELIKITQDMDIQNAGQKDLPKIIKAIETHINKTEYWKNRTDPSIKEFLDHIKIHKKNIHDIESLKDTEEELIVRLWDNDDVGRNIFFGNHVGCCTSIGKFNAFAAPQHLMNSFVNGIEIVDKGGNSLGNSMCYFAKVDGKLTFVIDSFEANGKLGAAPEVTDAIIDFAKKVCAEMGQPEANVMFGPNYNKVNFDRCVKTPAHTIEVIGRAPDETYIDCTGGHSDIDVVAINRNMHEIIDL